MSSVGTDLIPQGTAYGLLIGLGVLFCGVILIAIKVQKAYLSEDSATSEMFMVANRSVGTGLTASAVFSSWMWINETVLCAAMCYRYGLAVPLVRLCLYMELSRLTKTVVGIRSLLPDCAHGCSRSHGQNSSAVCSYFIGDHKNEIWHNWTFGLHRLELGQQRLWLCFYDFNRLSTGIWSFWHALCCSHHSDSLGR